PLFLFTPPPQPRSPPFPYTTIFRSRARRVSSSARDTLSVGFTTSLSPREVRLTPRASSSATRRAGVIASPPPRGRRHGRNGQNGDRKSTRLNSSHVSISYAVFCLKK